MSSSGGTGHGRGGKGKQPSGVEGQPAKKRARGHNGPVLVEEIYPKAAYSAVLQYYCTGNAPKADDKTMRTLWLCLDYEIIASPRLKALSALIYNHPDTMFHLVNWLLLNHDTLGPAPAPASCTETHRDHTRAAATTHNAHAPPPPSIGQGLLGQMFGVFGFDPLMGPMPVSSSSPASFSIPPRSASQPSHDTLRACLPLPPPPSQYWGDASVAVGGRLQCGGVGAAAVGAGAGTGRNGSGGCGTGPQASIDMFVEYGSPRLGRLLQYVWPHLQTRIDVRGLAAVGRNVLYHTDVLPPGLLSESLSLLEETGRKQYGKRSLVGVLCDAVRKDQTLHTEGGGGMPALAPPHAPTHAPTHTHLPTAVREMMVALLGAVAEGRTQEAVWAAVPAGLKTRVLSSVKQWTPSAISVVADAAVGCDADVLTAVRALSLTDHSALLDLAGPLVRSSRRTSKSLLLVWLSLQGQKLCDVLGVNDATGLVMARILGAVLDDDEDRVDDVDDRALKACGAPLLTALLHALMKPRGGLWHGKERDVMDTLHRVVRCMAAMDELECPLRKDLGLCQATIDFIVTVMRCVNDKSSAEKAFDFRRGGHDPDRDDFTGIARLINSALEAVLSICSASQVLPRAWFQKVLDSFEYYEKMIRDEHEDCGYECAYGRPFRLLTRFGELRQRIGAFYDIVEASDTSRPTTPAMTSSATFHPAANTASAVPPKHDRPHTRSGGGRRGGASGASHAPVAPPSAAGGQAQVHTDSNGECIICYAHGVLRLECCNRPVACVNNICASCLWRKLFTPDENQAYTCLLCRGDTRLRIYARRAGEEANTHDDPIRSTAGDMESIRRAAVGGGGRGGGGGGGGGGGSGGPGGAGRGANSANMMFGPPPDFLFPGPLGGPGGSSTVIRVGLPMGLGDGPNGEPNPLSVLRMVGEAISRGPPPFMSSRTQTNPHGHSRSSSHRRSRASGASRGGYGGDASIMSEFGSHGDMHGGGRRRDDGSEDSDDDSRGGASGDDHSDGGSDMSDEDDDHMFG